jgi:hypothetical protein
MPLARIITRLPQETAALAEYLRTQGYTVETVSSYDGDSSTLADLEISAEQYSLADAMTRARELAAQGWDIMVSPGVINPAPLEAPAEIELKPAAELNPEAILESQQGPAPMEAVPLESSIEVPLPEALMTAAPMETVPTARRPRMKMTRNWNRAWTQATRVAWSNAAQRAFVVLGKITAAAAYLWQTSKREAARFATRLQEFGSAQRAQSALLAANMAAKMKEIRRLKEEREALETAARLRHMESERETRIRQAHEREERARLLQLEAERESQRRAEHAAQQRQIQTEAEAARIPELQRQMQMESERESQPHTELPSSSESIHRAQAPANGNQYAANLRRRSSRQQDWQMAFAGAGAAAVVLIVAFGVLGARRPAEKFAPTHAVEQQLPFGAATIRPAASTIRPNTAPPPVAKANSPAARSASPVEGTAPRLVTTVATSSRKRTSTLPNNDSGDDEEVVVRHFAPLRAPARPATKKSADGVKHYSDLD